LLGASHEDQIAQGLAQALSHNRVAPAGRLYVINKTNRRFKARQG
jgi:hypothetical protein